LIKNEQDKEERLYIIKRLLVKSQKLFKKTDC